MKNFAIGVGVTITVYAIYFFSMSYFGPSFYVGANAGLLFVVYPAIAILGVGGYFGAYWKQYGIVAGSLVAFVFCIAVIQLLLAGV